MKPNEFWQIQHQQYANKDWIDKPSLFAQWAISYFPSTGSILELGAGHGQDTRYFASKGYTVTSTDFSDEALKFNISKVPSKLKVSITTEKLDISEPFSYDKAVYDIVYSHLAIHYFPKHITQKIFAEIYRVLKPSGILAILTNSTNDPEYNTGVKLEENYFATADLNKRYFSSQATTEFTSAFEMIVCDDQGETYKDKAIGVNNLIRYIGRKAL